MRYSRDFTIGERETQRFYRMLALQRWRGGAMVFGLVGALVGYLYIDWLDIPLQGTARIIACVLIGCMTAAFIALGIMFRTSRSVRTAIRRKGTDTYVQQTEIDGFGVRVTVDGEKAKVSFEKLHRVLETKNCFYLFLTGSDAWILPKEQMEDREAECAVIRGIFSKVIEPSRRKLRK